MFRVGDTIRRRAWFEDATGVGVAGLTVTYDYTDPSGNATTGASASAGAIAGEYYYALTVDEAGEWFDCFKCASAGLARKQVPASWEVEAVATIPTAVWGYATRTLTSFGTLAADAAAAVWAYAKATVAALADTTIGRYIYDKLGYIAGGSSITVVSGVASDGTCTTYRGDDYYSAQSRALTWTVDTWPDLTGATITITIYRAKSDGTNIVITTAVGSPQTVTLEYGAASTILIREGIWRSKILATRGGHVETDWDGYWVSKD